MNISIKNFRLISTLEALSFIVLLGIAMPLKYIIQLEIGTSMVSVVGMIHGILFIVYILGAFLIKQKLNWSFKTYLIVNICAIVPFGPFYAEKKYLKNEP